MGAKDITLFSLFLCFLLLIIPFLVVKILKLGLGKSIIISVSRMTIQLGLVGLFLKYIFDWNIWYVNLLWLMVMILFATFSVINTSDLNIKIFLPFTLLSFVFTTFLILFYFNKFVVGLDNIFESKYLIALGGMILGNALNGCIIGISNFYKNLKRNEERYLYSLSLGATIFEAAEPYFAMSMIAAMKPTIASMATIGIVSLPGMMTGQILGGSSPMVAIKYQIAMYIAIFTSAALSVFLSIFFTIKVGFDDYGLLRKEVFNK